MANFLGVSVYTFQRNTLSYCLYMHVLLLSGKRSILRDLWRNWSHSTDWQHKEDLHLGLDYSIQETLFGFSYVKNYAKVQQLNLYHNRTTL
jgi:hypothetical protein